MIDGCIDYPGIFRIYQFDENGEWSLRGPRTAAHRPGRRQHPLSPPAIALFLADVWIILATSIPKETALYLRNRGIMAFCVQGEVCRALDAYSKRGRLFNSLFPRIPGQIHDPYYSPHNPKER